MARGSGSDSGSEVTDTEPDDQEPSSHFDDLQLELLPLDDPEQQDDEDSE